MPEMTVRTLLLTSQLVAAFFSIPRAATAQQAPATGTIEFVARVTPTAARPEPARQFSFYLLRKSYADILREAEESDPVPDREQFIASLSVSQPLKDWFKAHNLVDLTTPQLDEILTGEDIISITEFLDAYQRANSGGVTAGLPKPKYSEEDKKKDPEKYARQRQEYLAALRKFIDGHHTSLVGMETQLDAVSPHRRWAQLQADQRRKVQRRTPELAQTRYLVAKVDTDLEGRASLAGIPAGTYWLSTLGLEAAAGDSRLRWDVEVTVQPGQTARLELTNLNAVESSGSAH
jgi:hypothetical protein